MLLNFRDGDRIDATEGLIQHHEFRVGDQGPGNRQTTLFTPAESQGLILGQIFDSKLSEQFVAAPVSFPARNPECLQDGKNVLFDGELSKDRLFLRKVPHAHSGSPMHRKAGHVTVLEINSAAVRPNKTYYKIEGGCFASTIWPKQAHNLSFIDVNIDPVHDRPATVNLDQFVRP